VTLRALLVDDEAPARATLRHLLHDLGGVDVVGEAEDAPTAVRLAVATAPDLVFLDVEMPETNGLLLAQRLPDGPQVVFTTAYDQYAAAAFELGAVDYLRKPFGRERLAAAVTRARQMMGHARPVDDESTVDLAERMRWVARATSGAAPLERLFVRDRGRIVVVRTADIVRLAGEDDYVAVHAEGRRLLVYLTLGEFERRLDPARFVRVHRSHIVNLDFVTALVPYDAARLEVRLRDGSSVVASRTASRELRQLVI
jgi:two-component system LytT family response regulator